MAGLDSPVNLFPVLTYPGRAQAAALAVNGEPAATMAVNLDANAAAGSAATFMSQMSSRGAFVGGGDGARLASLAISSPLSAGAEQPQPSALLPPMPPGPAWPPTGRSADRGHYGFPLPDSSAPPPNNVAPRTWRPYLHIDMADTPGQPGSTIVRKERDVNCGVLGLKFWDYFFHYVSSTPRSALVPATHCA